MKKILVFLLLLGTANCAKAANDTIWLNYKLDRIDGRWAEYYSIEEARVSAGRPVSIYHKLTQKLYCMGYLKDTTVTRYIKEGEFSFYGDDTRLIMHGQYSRNMKTGTWTEYYPAHTIFRKSNYFEDARKGADTMYYEAGILKRVDVYNADTVVSGKCFDIDGKPIAYSLYEEKPVYKEGFMQFLSDNIVYPPAAKRDRVMGKVILRFVLDKDGNVKNIKVAKSVRGDLDEEAMRVLLLKKLWLPGKREGKTVDMDFTQPITFRLE